MTVVPAAKPILTPIQYGAQAPEGSAWPLNSHDRGLYTLNDLYPTVQGEGRLAGTPMTIVRLQSCPVGCVWCDTPESWKVVRQWQSANAVASRVRALAPLWALVTGGEPTWHHLEALTSALGRLGLRRALETSGVYPLTGIWEWVCVSPKPEGLMPLNLATLAKAHEVKWLVGRERDIQAAEAFVSKVRSDQAFCLQPISASPKATRLCVEALMQHPTWYLSLQTHKMVRIA